MSDTKITSSSSSPLPERPAGVSGKKKLEAAKVAGSAGPKSVDAVTRLVESDVLEISGPARQVAKLREEIAKVPDVREERIADIKARIKSGTYAVPSREVARKMIEWGRDHGGTSPSSG
jgi:flagellar biosynthesis anti-sigma factor FlgM